MSNVCMFSWFVWWLGAWNYTGLKMSKLPSFCPSGYVWNEFFLLRGSHSATTVHHQYSKESFDMGTATFNPSAAGLLTTWHIPLSLSTTHAKPKRSVSHTPSIFTLPIPVQTIFRSIKQTNERQKEHKPHITCELYWKLESLNLSWCESSWIVFAPAGNLSLHFPPKMYKYSQRLLSFLSLPSPHTYIAFTTYYFDISSSFRRLNISDLSWSWCCSRWFVY